jgi:hypothetical protein
MGGQPKTYPDKKQLHEYLGRNQRYIPFHKVFQILFFEKRRGFVSSFFILGRILRHFDNVLL